MQVSQWSSCDATCNRSIMFMSSQQAVSGQEELQRTPVRKQNRSASRKNLSRSFSQILNEEFGEDGEKQLQQSESEALRMLPLIHSELITVTTAAQEVEDDDDDDEVFVGGRRWAAVQQDKKRLFVRTRSAQATTSESIYRTDSGFNDDDLTISSARSPSVTRNTSLSMTMTTTNTSEDVSMRSLRCD